MHGSVGSAPKILELAAVQSDVDRAFQRNGNLTVMYVHFPKTQIIEERFGFEALSALEGITTTRLSQVTRSWRGNHEIILARGFAEDFVVFVAGMELTDHLPERLAAELMRGVRRVDEELAELATVHVGHQRVQLIEKMRSSRLIQHAIRQALLSAVDSEKHALEARLDILRRLIKARDFRIVYQPIVEPGGGVFAYEALCRSKAPEFSSPLVLFDTAERTNTVWALSRLIRELAVEPIGALSEGCSLFVNLHPHDFDDPQLLALEDFMRPWSQRIVFEITERAAISSYDELRKNVARLTSHGYRIAVDDLGSGYASLNSVAMLDPHFIKIDMGLVRNIQHNSPQDRVVRTIIDFANRSGSKVIAEGIETEDERQALLDVGCHYMQGYLFARPEPPFATPRRFD